MPVSQGQLREFQITQRACDRQLHIHPRAPAASCLPLSGAVPAPDGITNMPHCNRSGRQHCKTKATLVADSDCTSQAAQRGGVLRAVHLVR
eukprot:14277266-Alexandrium_andersonii.AAC.1